MNRKVNLLLAAVSSFGAAGLLATSAMGQSNIFTLQSNLLQYNPNAYNSNASLTYTNPPTVVYGTGMTQDLTQPNNVETQPDGHGGIEVTMTYADAPGTTVASGENGDLVLSTWNSSNGVANLNLSGFTDFELQFTNLDPNGGAYVQAVMKIGSNWQWVQGENPSSTQTFQSNGGWGAIGNYNDPTNPTANNPSMLMDWTLDPNNTGNSDQDPNWSTDIASVREIRLQFWTPNNIVPPSGGAHFDIDPVPIVPGDTDGNGTVDNTDLANMVANYKSQTVLYGEYTVGDFNGDGLVNGDDFAIFALDEAEYQASLKTAAVPEPASLSVLSLAGLMVFLRRRLARD